MGNVSIALNAAKDIYLDVSGNLALANDLAAVQQDCLTAMRAQFGEMVLQPNRGIPNLADVWLTVQLAQWEAAARTTIANVPGVVQLVSLTYTVADGALTYAATIQTIYSKSATVNDTLAGAV